MALARGWARFVLPVALLAAGLLIGSLWEIFLLGPGVALLILAALVAGFFRDPDRAIGDGIVAAADGRVQHVDEDGIVTFLNVHDMHVVRAPYDGRVDLVERFDGLHRPAFLESSKKNAGVRVEMETEHGREEVRLVAGLLARRAIAWVEAGDRVSKGERIGMIRFGSRVDITLPSEATPVVHGGDRIRAGETTLAVHETQEDST